METALGWLGDIIRVMMSFIPHLKIVKATHAGVKFSMGRWIKPMLYDNGIWIPFKGRSGLHLYWPLVTEIEIVPIKRQTTNLVPQYLITRDGQSVGVSGVVVHEISDVIRLLTKCWDYDETIRDYALAAIKRVVTENDYSFFQTSPDEADKALTIELRKDLRRIGVRAIRVTLSDFAKCFVLATWGQ